MILGNFTYDQLALIVKQWIINHCYNFNAYSTMHECVKNGSKIKLFTQTDPKGKAYTEDVYMTISSPLRKQTTTTVNRELNNFLINDCNVNLSDIVTEDNFFSCINNLMCFCATKLAFVASQYGPNPTDTVKYLIYHSANTQYTYYSEILPSEEEICIIKASDVTTFIDRLLELMTRKNGNIRTLNVKAILSIERNH